MTYQPKFAATEIETRFTKQKSARMKERFLKGPIPLAQIASAAKLPGKSLTVYITLHHQSAMARRDQVTLPKGLLAQLGVSRDAKARALSALEQAGLVQVEKEKGKGSLVMLTKEHKADGPAQRDVTCLANTQWAIVSDGIRCLEHDYCIAKTKLAELRESAGPGIAMWPLQMSEKSWVDIEEFLSIFERALIVHRPVGAERLLSGS